MIARVLIVLVPGLVMGAVSFGACSSVGNSQIGIAAPPYSDQSFTPVGEYLENRCGTLDCHGQVGRGLRLFSGNGLRAFDASGNGYFPYTTGKDPPQEDEMRQNYLSVVGLEPEVMADVMAGGGADPMKLLLLKKPLLYEAHKGGQIMIDISDPGYKCIASWLAGLLDQDACTRSLVQP